MVDLRQRTQVSIIIPIHNAEQYLRRCLDSVMNQTHACLEVMLIDDGSTDRSKSICEEYVRQDCRFQYIYQMNQGAAIARNAGIDCATSEYVTFLDSDDSMEPGFVKQVLTEMLMTGSDIGICDINYVDNETAEKEVSRIRFYGKTASASKTKSIFNTVRTFIWGKIYKRELFDKIRFPNLKFFEDLSIVPFMAAIANQIVYIPLPLINYFRNRNGSLSENAYNIGELIRALDLLGSFLRSSMLYDDFTDSYKKMCMAQLRFTYRRFENRKQENVLEQLCKLKEYVLNLFPQLYPLTECSFYIERDNHLLAQAIDKAVLYNDQIVDNIEVSNYIICFSDCVTEGVSQPTIAIKRPEHMDEESAAYDIAEEIIMAFS